MTIKLLGIAKFDYKAGTSLRIAFSRAPVLYDCREFCAEILVIIDFHRASNAVT